MKSSRAFSGIDWITIILSILLIVFGIMNVYSVEASQGIRQLTWFGLGILLVIGLIAASNIAWNFFDIYSPIFYIFSILLLIGVLIFGKEIHGAKAWYSFGGFSFQPVEFSKIATGLFLANYISRASTEIKSQKTILTSFLILLIPIFLILMQPDLGSVIVFSAFFIALYREGFSFWFIFIPIVCGALFISSVIYPVLYVLIAVGWFFLIICILSILFTQKKDYLVLSGLLSGLVFYFVILMLLAWFFPSIHIENEVEKELFESVNIFENPFKFNVILSSGIGFLLSLIVIIIIQLSISKEKTNSPYRTSSLNPTRILGIVATTLFVLLCIIGISTSSPFIYEKLPTHHKERIMVLFEGELKYRDTSGYNLLYSKTAIGSGDLWGKGYMQGTVKMGKFVPEQTTDYIFCTVGEEWGFVGSSLLIIIYALFIMRLYYLAETQKNKFSRFFGYSVASIFLMHFFINIAMVMGLFPTVGIPLPFFSYGGSSLWGFMAMLSIFLILNYRDKQTLI